MPFFRALFGRVGCVITWHRARRPHAPSDLRRAKSMDQAYGSSKWTRHPTTAHRHARPACSSLRSLPSHFYALAHVPPRAPYAWARALLRCFAMPNALRCQRPASPLSRGWCQPPSVAFEVAASAITPPSALSLASWRLSLSLRVPTSRSESP